MSLFRTAAPCSLALACALALFAPMLPAPMAFAADATALPKGTAAGPCVEGICEYTLGNGLRVLLFPDASKPTVTVNIAYGVGSVHENYGETGMAHLLEHLMFKGTPKHVDIPAEMKQRGIEKNASTSLDRTNYFGSFPANDDTLDWLLGLEADRMRNAFVAKKDLDSEMTVVRNEMESNENNPGNVLNQRIRSTAYLWHNYGNTTVGARSDVENVSIERLQAFYRTWYRPDNATLVVAGRIDPASTLARVQKYFAPIKRPVAPIPKFYTVEPAQDGEREVVLRRRGDVNIVAASYHVPGTAHADSAALTILMNILGDTPSGRLHKALVETKLAVFAAAGQDSLRENSLARAIFATAKDADTVRTQAELLRQVETLAAQPITAEEVSQAKQRFANAYEQSLSNVNAIAIALTESVSAGDWRLYFLQRDRIAQVTADDVNRVARTYFKQSNRTIGRFIPTEDTDRVEIAAAPSAADILKGYVGKAAVAAGETFDPTPANIDARTETFTIGDTLKVSLLPKDTRGDTVIFSANFRFGDVDSLKRSPGQAGDFAGSLLMSGSSTMTREQIAQRFDALKTSGGVSGGLQSANIGLNSRREHLVEAVALAAELLRSPSYPESEFEQLRLQSITGLEAARKEPATLASLAMDAHFDPWPNDHPLAFKSIDASLAEVRALKREDLVAFHRDFYGSNEGEIVVVGDFDPVAVKAQLRALFGEWRTAKPYAIIHTRYVEVAADSKRIETPDKANAIVVARSNVSLNDNDPDYPALMLANTVFGGDPVKARLADRLRQKDGLTYGVGSDISADSSPEGRDDAGSFSVQALVAPQNAERLIAAMREELKRFIEQGISETELKDAVNTLLTQRQQARASDGALTGALARNLRMGRTMAWSAHFDAALKALTVANVQAAIRKHLKPETLSVYAAGDFAKAAATAAPAVK